MDQPSLSNKRKTPTKGRAKLGVRSWKAERVKGRIHQRKIVSIATNLDIGRKIVLNYCHWECKYVLLVLESFADICDTSACI